MLPDRSNILDQNTLRDELRASGVARGDLLVVHSSLKAVGHIEGGPVALIRALEEIIGPTGTLMMPTFTFNLQGWDMGVYDPGRTASRVGMLTEVFRRQPGVRRSLHPTHSVAARGMMAEELTEGVPTIHEPLGPGSPFDRARLFGGKILLLGVGQNRNSTIHLAEHLAELPYLDVPFNEYGDFDAAWYCESTGRPPQLVKIRQMPGSSEGFVLIDHLLEGKGIFRRGQVGNATTTTMMASELCDVVSELLIQQPDLLLRHDTASVITRRRLDYLYRVRPELLRGNNLVEQGTT